MQTDPKTAVFSVAQITDKMNTIRSDKAALDAERATAQSHITDLRVLQAAAEGDRNKKLADMDAIADEIRRLQQVYGDRLEILLGLEHDAYAPYSDFPYDYQIESVHHIWVDGQHCFVDWDREKMEHAINTCFGGDIFAYAKYYFSVCAAAYEKIPVEFQTRR